MPDSAQDVLRGMLREDVAPLIREFGFKGSGRTFRRQNSLGDLAFVNFQGSDTSTAQEARFYVNLAVVPRPWFDMRTDGWPKKPKPSESFGLMRTRLMPHGGQRWAVSDSFAARSVGDQVVAHLRDANGLPDLLQMLDRQRLIDRLQSGDLDEFSLNERESIRFDFMLSTLLVDQADDAAYEAIRSRIAARTGEPDPYGWIPEHLAWLDRYRLDSRLLR